MMRGGVQSAPHAAAAARVVRRRVVVLVAPGVVRARVGLVVPSVRRRGGPRGMLVPRLGRPLAGHRRRRAPRAVVRRRRRTPGKCFVRVRAEPRGGAVPGRRARVPLRPRRGPGGTPVVLAVPRVLLAPVLLASAGDLMAVRGAGGRRRRGRRRRFGGRPGLVGGVLGGLRGAAPATRARVELVGLRAPCGRDPAGGSATRGRGGAGSGAPRRPGPGRNSSRAGGSPRLRAGVRLPVRADAPRVAGPSVTSPRPWAPAPAGAAAAAWSATGAAPRVPPPEAPGVRRLRGRSGLFGRRSCFGSPARKGEGWGAGT